MNEIDGFIAATKMRAKAYFYIFNEMETELGAMKAARIFSQATYRLGMDVGRGFSKKAGNDPRVFAEEFVSNPVTKKIFNQDVIDADQTSCTIEMKSCPLVTEWSSMGLDDEVIKKLCTAAHSIDFGTIEPLGYKLSFNCRISDGNESCVLKVVKKNQED